MNGIQKSITLMNAFILMSAFDLLAQGAWKGVNIGEVKVQGTFRASEDLIEIRGAGEGFSQNVYYVYKEVEGDGEFVAQCTTPGLRDSRSQRSGWARRKPLTTEPIGL